MRAPQPAIFPRPRRCQFTEGSLDGTDPRFATWLKGLPQTLTQASQRLNSSERGTWQVIKDAKISAEGYRLIIHPTRLELLAADARGLLYGCDTLQQLLRQASPAGLACLEIEDAPDLAVRGFMLDISRCKVPTRHELLKLVDSAFHLRLNQLQLYVEHTFAFPGHETVWGEASPLTVEDLRAVGTRCEELGIEWVPNLNTFGHLERWLRHEPYRQLAECPDGWTHPLTNQFKPNPSTLFPSEASLKFVASLLDAYLPHFTSNQVNIGGDEPWELGQGRSCTAVAERGKHHVYLEFLNQIHGLVRARGKRMQFWGDILLEDLTLAAEAPQEALPVVWGYDPGHPFDSQCARLAELGRDYLIAPGASNWQTFTGRLNQAQLNIHEAATAARRHRAKGLLMTSWGDNGNHQPWPSFWIPLVEMAAQAWRHETVSAQDRVHGVAAFLDAPHNAPAVVLALDHLGGLDNKIAYSLRNKSISWEGLTLSESGLAKLIPALAREDLELARDWLSQATPLIGAIHNPLVREELATGQALADAGLARLLGKPIHHTSAQALEARYRATWLQRARPGGLAESCEILGLTAAA
jgi:hypothetical protein